MDTINIRKATPDDAGVILVTSGTVTSTSRQVLAELCPPELPVHIAVRGRLTEVRTFTLAELLPHTFRL